MKHFAGMLAVAFLGALFLVSAAPDARAQMSWELGLKAGVSAAKLTGDDTKYEFTEDADNFEKGDLGDMKVGFVGGGYGTLHVNKQFGVRLEALYFQKGGKGTVEGEVLGEPFTADATITMDYFELPLLAVFSIPAGTSGMFDIFAGPTLGFKVTAKEKWESGGQEEEGDIEDAKSTDFGGVVGVGFTMMMDSMNLFADARWGMGFSSVIEAEGDDEIDVKNQAFAFMIGVAFPLASGGGATTQ